MQKLENFTQKFPSGLIIVNETPCPKQAFHMIYSVSFTVQLTSEDPGRNRLNEWAFGVSLIQYFLSHSESHVLQYIIGHYITISLFEDLLWTKKKLDISVKFLVLMTKLSHKFLGNV